ncbi:MAG: pyridoxamine 5'-phosphate oxidase family protein [Emcibacteraceae bacterium]|nr:pyridoxamine 5'-phosphate oxidase family protein [Emcibacteraceae bacterium]
MTHKYAKLMFTDNVKDLQQQQGSRNSYARMEEGEVHNALLGAKEAEFILESDSFYMASVSETGWPYVQHRGGPKGFVKIIDEATIGFADYRGNKQYISVGNFQTTNKVSLFFMDYKNKRRLKMIGHIMTVEENDKDILEKLQDPDYKGKVERGFIISIDAFDWNCPQHITQRYTKEDIQPLFDKLAELEGEGTRA